MKLIGPNHFGNIARTSSEKNKILLNYFKRAFLLNLNKRVIYKMKIILNVSVPDHNSEIPIGWIFKSGIKDADEILKIDEELANQLDKEREN
ncbi:MAG: hypothetical protein HQM08_29910 [Candidatus Riflebacteria bacterium]|nr:hypothetical protein [Candidatus Riflebacteria bacterium]